MGNHAFFGQSVDVILEDVSVTKIIVGCYKDYHASVFLK